MGLTGVRDFVIQTESNEIQSSDPYSGLTSAEVAERVSKGQVNRLPKSDWSDYRVIIVRNFATLFNAIVVVAAGALFFLAEYRSAWAVSAMAILNTAIGLVQEIRAKRHLAKLTLLTIPSARVRRDGAERKIAADEIVSDDGVLLAAGEAVVADGIVIQSRYLEVDEALLTGESEPMPRKIGERLLSGSYCVAGEGIYRVDKLGAESFANRTAAQARLYRYAPTPLQRTLDNLIRILTLLAVGLCLSYVGLDYLRGYPKAEVWQMIAATMTSMVPQGLVLTTTIMLTLGALRISRQGAIVQRLTAIESMAAIDVLCMDKTGTLTTGNLKVAAVKAFHPNEQEVLKWLRMFVWSSIDSKNKSILAIRHFLGEPSAAEKPEIIDQVPFKSQNRYSVVRIRSNGAERTFVLGGFEALRPFLKDCESAEEHWKACLPSGLRLLLFAEATAKDIADASGYNGDAPLEGIDLRPLAFVTLEDEMRPEAAGVLKALAAQNIALKILSGDNPETVRALVSQLGISSNNEPVLSGTQLDAATNRAEAIRSHSIFGRVTPQQKLDVIQTLQAEGRRVGMIGDGVNDVLALKRADLGIAMGSGSMAAKTVAGLVLEYDDFSLLPKTLHEGKIILCNLRRTAKLFLLKNVYSLFLIVVGMGILGFDFPYLPQQVSLLNALTIGGPTLLILLGRKEDLHGVRGDFLREVGRFAISSGLVMALAGLLIWSISSHRFGCDLDTRRTLLLSTLILMGLGNALVIAEGAEMIWAWSVFAIFGYSTVMYVSALAYFFVLSPLSFQQWILAIMVSAGGMGFSRLIAFNHQLSAKQIEGLAES